MDISQRLSQWSHEYKERFVEERRVLSFPEYLDLFLERPRLLGRSAPQYLLDAIHHQGMFTKVTPTGTRRHFGVFDANQSGHQAVVGQEETEESFYQAICSQVRESRGNRLLLLHGPNGSAKSSFVQCLAKALVEYSRTPDGAIYTFSWIFPRSQAEGKRVGFDRGDGASQPLPSYAFLDELQIAARLPCDVRDNPLFLLDQNTRRGLLSSPEVSQKLPEDYSFPHHLVFGDLAPGGRAIFDTLLNYYQGDLQRVMAHVRVERFEFSRRYRQGIAIVEPQMHVDAQARQITMDETFGQLPPVLRHLSLHQLSGDLVDAHRGLVEYSDLLKRPLDAFKYLLGTCETSRVELPGAAWYIDAVLLGTTNDKYLHAFTKSPEFSSFKGRMELIRVPYLRDYRAETRIYEGMITPDNAGRPIAPHALEMAALWAVLTRLRKPESDRYPSSLRTTIQNLSPLEKADLYATGQPPAHLSQDQTRALVAAIPDLYTEFDQGQDYEGFLGASAREIRSVLFRAAQAPDIACLHPVQVFEEIRGLSRQTALYEFLNVPAAGDYHSPEPLLALVEERYLHILESEFRQALGLVGPEEFERLLTRYATHASAFLKKERVMDVVTQKEVPADEGFLLETEKIWRATEDPTTIRQEFLGRIASFSLDHPGTKPIYRTLFPDAFQKMSAHYYGQQDKEIQTALQWVSLHLSGAPLKEDPKTRAQEVIQNLQSLLGYTPVTLPPTISWFQKRRNGATP